MSVRKTVDNPQEYTLGQKYLVDGQWMVCVIIDYDTKRVVFRV